MRIALALVVAMLFVSRAVAAEEHPPTHTPAGHTAHAGEAENYPHPQIAEPSIWPGTMLLIVIAMFISAAVVGPITRSETPEEVPPAHSHDEPPGASHHHGPGGTQVVDPHD